jgi:ABC-2 type transport system permease protein
VVRLINAEFIKLRTTQVWFWLLLAAVAIAALFVIGPLASRDGINTTADAVDMFTSSATSYVAVFVLGVLGVTTEFRYQTITPTVLATPSRWALITAKMITYALVGAAYAAICLIVQLAIALPWLSSKNIDFSLSSEHVPRALGGVFAVVALFGIVGLGVGALLKNQIVAVTVGVIFLLVLQNLLIIIPGVKHVFPFMPGGGVASILTITGERSENGVHLLAPWGGVAVLLAWAFIPAILGAAITMNRDIT